MVLYMEKREERHPSIQVNFSVLLWEKKVDPLA